MRTLIEMPLASGDYAEDCAAGRRSAARAVELLRSGVAPLALQQAAEQLTSRPTFDGVSVGFFAGLAARLS